jgi:hypothetical protein
MNDDRYKKAQIAKDLNTAKSVGFLKGIVIMGIFFIIVLIVLKVSSLAMIPNNTNIQFIKNTCVNHKVRLLVYHQDSCETIWESTNIKCKSE